jgi:hypothetical protein
VDRKDRIARNEALFREVNERVREVRPEDGEDTLGFLCECGDEACTETVYLSVATYEDVRSDSTMFVVAPGHEIKDVEEPVWRAKGYVIVRKHAEEAAIALDTDPRV